MGSKVYSVICLNTSQSQTSPSQWSTTRLAKQKDEICCSEVRNLTNMLTFISAMTLLNFIFSKITFLPIKSESYFKFNSNNCARPDVSWKTVCANRFSCKCSYWADPLISALIYVSVYIHGRKLNSFYFLNWWEREYQYCNWDKVLGLQYANGRSFCVFYVFPLPFAFPSVQYRNIILINIDYLKANNTGFSRKSNVLKSHMWLQ